MNSNQFKELLEELHENEEKITSIAAPLYQKRNELVNQLVPEFIKRKAPECNGVLTTPLTVKFKDGSTYTLKPMYIDKAGTYKGACFKAYGVELFSIIKK